MTPPDPWWHAAPVKGLASLGIALAITFLPLAINKIRARARAPAVEIVASPGIIADTLGSAACDSATTDSSATCQRRASKSDTAK